MNFVEKFTTWGQQHHGWEAALDKGLQSVAKELSEAEIKHLPEVRALLANAYLKDPTAFADGRFFPRVNPDIFAARANKYLEILVADNRQTKRTRNREARIGGPNPWETSPPYVHGILESERSNNPKFSPVRFISRDYMNGGDGKAVDCLTGLYFNGEPSFLALPFKEQSRSPNNRLTIIDGPFDPIMPTVLHLLHEYGESRDLNCYVFGAECIPAESINKPINQIETAQALQEFLERALQVSDKRNRLLPNVVLFIPEIDKHLKELANTHPDLKNSLITQLFRQFKQCQMVTPVISISDRSRFQAACSGSGFNLRELYHLSRSNAIITHLPTGVYTPTSHERLRFTNLPSNITGETALCILGNHAYGIGSGNEVKEIIFAARTNYWKKFEIDN